MEENKDEKKVNLENEIKENITKEIVTKKEDEQKDVEVKKEIDEQKFRKVEINNKTKSKKEEKTSHKLIRTILVMIIILIGLYCIYFCRNLIILNQIAESMNQYNNVTNFSFESVSTEKNETINLKFSQKENTRRMEISATEEKQIILWVDTQTKEEILAYPSVNKAIKSNNTESFRLKLPMMTDLNYQSVKGLMSLTTFIYSENYDSKDCYVITLGEQKTWIDKNTGFVLKREYASRVVEYKNIQVNNVSDIYKPDLTGYEVQEQ